VSIYLYGPRHELVEPAVLTPPSQTGRGRDALAFACRRALGILRPHGLWRTDMAIYSSRMLCRAIHAQLCVPGGVSEKSRRTAETLITVEGGHYYPVTSNRLPDPLLCRHRCGQTRQRRTFLSNSLKDRNVTRFKWHVDRPSI